MGILYDVYVKHKNIDDYTERATSDESLPEEENKKKCSSEVKQDKNSK